MGARSHPVIEVLRRRRDQGSLPGARGDPHRVAVVLEGGGMRGVVSAGMAAALERLGLTAGFDLVVGSSAGALNGAGLLGGMASTGPGMYAGPLASRRFINPARLLVGRPAVDLAFLLGHAAATLGREQPGEFRPLGEHSRPKTSPPGELFGEHSRPKTSRPGELVGEHSRPKTSRPGELFGTFAGGVPLVCVAVDVDTAQPRTFADVRTMEELWQVLQATMRMPLFGGRPVEIEGRRYLDGALAEPVPLAAALEAGATHVLVLQTRPYGVPRSTGSRVAERLVERHLRGLNPRLGRMWRERAAAYEHVVGHIAERSTRPGARPPHVLGLRPAAGTPVVGQLERRSPVLALAAAAAERLVEEAFGGEARSATAAWTAG